MLTEEQMVAEMFARGARQVNYRGTVIRQDGDRYHVQGGSWHLTVARAVEYIDKGIAREKSPEAKEAAKKAMMEALAKQYPPTRH